MVWAFATSGRRSEAIFDVVQREILARGTSRFKSQELANTAWAYAKISHDAPALFDMIQKELLANRNLETFIPQVRASVSISARASLLVRPCVRAHVPVVSRARLPIPSRQMCSCVRLPHGTRTCPHPSATFGPVGTSYALNLPCAGALQYSLVLCQARLRLSSSFRRHQVHACSPPPLLSSPPLPSPTLWCYPYL